MKKKDVIFLLVSADEFSLPIDFAYSIQEIAKKYGIKEDTAYRNYIRHSKNSLGFYIEKVLTT